MVREVGVPIQTILANWSLFIWSSEKIEIFNGTYFTQDWVPLLGILPIAFLWVLTFGIDCRFDHSTFQSIDVDFRPMNGGIREQGHDDTCWYGNEDECIVQGNKRKFCSISNSKSLAVMPLLKLNRLSLTIKVV